MIGTDLHLKQFCNTAVGHHQKILKFYTFVGRARRSSFYCAAIGRGGSLFQIQVKSHPLTWSRPPSVPSIYIFLQQLNSIQVGIFRKASVLMSSPDCLTELQVVSFANLRHKTLQPPLPNPRQNHLGFIFRTIQAPWYQSAQKKLSKCICS